MAAALAASTFDARISPAGKRARAFTDRLRLALAVMALLNILVWGGMIATARGMVDAHRLADQAWALGAELVAALPQVSVTLSR